MQNDLKSLIAGTFQGMTQPQKVVESTADFQNQLGPKKRRQNFDRTSCSVTPTTANSNDINDHVSNSEAEKASPSSSDAVDRALLFHELWDSRR